MKALKALKASLKAPAPPAVKPPADDPPCDFKSLFTDVKPLKDSRRVFFAMPKPGVHPRRQARCSEGEVPIHAIGWFEAVDAEGVFKRSGLQAGTLKRLRAGHWPVCAELDLHGMNRTEAQDNIAVFLHRTRRLGNCVRIIHGKGISSRGEPVLKRMTRTWLTHHPDVLAFCETSGGGALLVLLRRNTE